MRNQGRNLDAGAETATMKEHCSLTCSQALWSATFLIRPKPTYINQHSISQPAKRQQKPTPLVSPKANLMESVLPMKFPLPKWVKLTTKMSCHMTDPSFGLSPFSSGGLSRGCLHIFTSGKSITVCGKAGLSSSQLSHGQLGSVCLSFRPSYSLLFLFFHTSTEILEPICQDPQNSYQNLDQKSLHLQTNSEKTDSFQKLGFPAMSTDMWHPKIRIYYKIRVKKITALMRKTFNTAVLQTGRVAKRKWLSWSS